MQFSPNPKKIKTKISQKIRLKLRIVLLALFVISPLLAQARTFNPHNIITDQDLTNKDSLSQTAIQKFLERENSVLARYSQVINGQAMTAAAMIWQIGQKHNISPKYLLATLEKEQSLIHKTQATEKALDWACGYGCYGGSCKEKYRGFYNQVEAAAETQQIYWQKAGQFSFRAGVTTKTYDGFAVTPANKATANFYIYTPYVGYAPELGVTSPYGGNKLFWVIWSRYFTDQKFLDGQVLTNGSDYWLIEQNQKRKFITPGIFLADYEPADAILASAKDLAAYPDGPAVYFSNKTLVKSAASGQIFFLQDGVKHPLFDSAALAQLADFRLALAETDIRAVSEDQISQYSLGSNISAASVYPQGKLFKDETGTIWLVQDGLKHAVDPVVLGNRFSGQTPEPSTAAEMLKYTTGGPILLKDGTFISYNGNYYLISQSERMKIVDLTIFDRVFGLNKKNSALPVSQAAFELHAAGDMIDYIDDTVQDAIVYAPNAPAETPAAPSGSLQAELISLQPEALLPEAGASQGVTVQIKNIGSAVWQNGAVWLKVTDNSGQNLYGSLEKINFAESAVSGSQIATFVFTLVAPQKTGVNTLKLTLASANNAEIFKAAKFIIVKPAASQAPAVKAAAAIVSQNIPASIKNTAKPVAVTMQIKNTGTTTWLSRRTALEVYNQNGTTSYFYDPNDWIRKNVAAVPVNKSQIKPGETGVFKFTLDPSGIKKGTYTLKFQLKQLDVNQEVLLEGAKSWEKKITVN